MLENYLLFFKNKCTISMIFHETLSHKRKIEILKAFLTCETGSPSFREGNVN